MEIKTITEKEKQAFDTVVSHPLQTFEWGEFREKTGVEAIRRGFFEEEKLVSGFTLTLHQIPHTPRFIGYLPKGDFPDEGLISELKRIGKQEKCIFIQLEPNARSDSNQEPRVENQEELRIKHLGLVPAAHPLFTKYTFVLDLTRSEEELLKAMHHKARYNIRVAQRHGVEVVEDNSDEAFEQYWKLMEETTKRQQFYAHTKQYHQLQWETLKTSNVKNALTSHLFLAKYQGKVLTAWLLFVFKDTLYYPYGASSREHKEVMHSSLMMWEAVRFGKRLGLREFDLWGAMGPNPDPNDSWFGFHTFKERFGPEHGEFVGSYDLVIDPVLYQGYKLADKLRWLYLRMKR